MKSTQWRGDICLCTVAIKYLDMSKEQGAWSMGEEVIGDIFPLLDKEERLPTGIRDCILSPDSSLQSRGKVNNKAPGIGYPGAAIE